MLIQEAELEQWLREEGDSQNRAVVRSWNLRRAPEAPSTRFSTDRKDRVDRRPRLKLINPTHRPVRSIRQAMAS